MLVFFYVNFLQSGEGKKKEKKKRKLWKVRRVSLWKKIGPKSPHHEGGEKKNLNSPYLENRFQRLAKFDRKKLNFLFWTCNQILAKSSCAWSHQPTHLLQKFEKRKRKKKNSGMDGVLPYQPPNAFPSNFVFFSSVLLAHMTWKCD